MDRQQADLLVSALGQQLGLPELKLDEEATAIVVVGSQTIVMIGYHAQRGTIELAACLDEVALTGPALRDALAANFAWVGSEGATFAIDPRADALVLQRRCTAAQSADGGLFTAFEALVESAETWTKRLASSTADRPAEPAGAMPLGGMMRA